MSAVPKQLLSVPKVKGLKAIKNKQYSLSPVNAAASSQFRYDGVNMIEFQIPSFKNSWFSPTRSFLRMNVKSDTGCWMADGAPVISRLRLSIGNVVCEDLMNYSQIERCLLNLESVASKYAKAIQSGDFRATPMISGSVSSTSGILDDITKLKEIWNNNPTIEKNLVSGVLGKDFNEHYVPLGHFHSGSTAAMSLTLWLEDPAIACVADTVVSPGYTLENVSFECEVVELPQAINEKLDAQLSSGNAYKLPYQTFRSHMNHIPASSQNVELTINESAHNLREMYSVLVKQSRPAITDWANFGVGDNLFQYGGKGDRTKLDTDATYTIDGAVKSYQIALDTDMYPLKRSEMGQKDSQLAYLNAIHSLDKYNDDCFAGSLQPNTETWWDEGGCWFIGQSFATSRDNYLNGANTSASNSPVKLSITLRKPAASAYSVLSFCKSDYQINVKKGGHVDIINGDRTENLE